MTTSTTIPAFFQANIRTLADIVEAINDGGTAMSTVAEIAGHYAFDAATDNLDYPGDVVSIDADTIFAHLDVLTENGAEFDYSEATADALARVAYATACINDGNI